jgi:PadR family transcriptional regulator, regulatory protein PadR
MQVIKGTLDLIVLKTLSWQPMHGFAIAARIDQHFGGDLVLEEGAMYQSLRRMEERELISGEWGLSENNRRARFYKITPRGRQLLRQEAANWERYSVALTRLLRLA